MINFIKKNIFISIIFLITLSLGFITFLTFINKSFVELNDKNLQFLLIINIGLLLLLLFMIFKEVKKSILLTFLDKDVDEEYLVEYFDDYLKKLSNNTLNFYLKGVIKP